MSILFWFTTAILTFHMTQSYILLTANLDDVQTIAKQLAQSPVAGQLTNIWRRAADQFANTLHKPVKPPTHRSNVQPLYEEEEDQQQASGYQNMRRSNNQPQDDQPQDNQPQDNQPQEVGQNQRSDDQQQQQDEEFVALGRNASRYLKSIKKILQKDQM